MNAGRRIASCAHALAGFFVVQIALQGEGVALALPVHAKTALDISPIVKIPAIRMILGSASEAHAVNPVGEVFAVTAAVAQIGKALLFVAAARGN